MRLLEYRDLGGGILENIPAHIRAASPKLLKLHITGTPDDVIGFAEISAPTAVMGLSTAVVIETNSADALDKNHADGAVRAQEFIGINENNEMLSRQEVMHPTNGTSDQATTNLYKEIFHSFAVLWGIGADKNAEGQIDISTIADAIQVSIPITENESNGARFLVPDGHVAMLFGGRLTRLTETVDEGQSIRIVYTDPIDAVGVDSILNNWLEFVINGAAVEQYTVIPKGHVFESGTWLKFQHSSLVDLGEAYDLTLDFLIWKK